MDNKYICNAGIKKVLIQGIKEKIGKLYRELYEYERQKNNNMRTK